MLNFYRVNEGTGEIWEIALPKIVAPILRSALEQHSNFLTGSTDITLLDIWPLGQALLTRAFPAGRRTSSEERRYVLAPDMTELRTKYLSKGLSNLRD